LWIFSRIFDKVGSSGIVKVLQNPSFRSFSLAKIQFMHAISHTKITSYPHHFCAVMSYNCSRVK
jgi:hypothetical protein